MQNKAYAGFGQDQTFNAAQIAARRGEAVCKIRLHAAYAPIIHIKEVDFE